MDASDDPPSEEDAAVDAAPPPPPLMMTGPNRLPCDVRSVLDRRCVHCHTDPVSSGATRPLLTRAAFFELSPDASRTIGEVSAERVHADTLPMPPVTEPPISREDADVLSTWVEAGMPAGTCGAIPGLPAPAGCTSRSVWTGGDRGSIDMRPGVACKSCHNSYVPERAYYFAGTVYPTFHEKDNCNSPPPEGARVEILDMDGNVTLTMLPQPSGNFQSASIFAEVPTPYRARVVVGELVREMKNPQTDGDCNACHTEQGVSRPKTTDIRAPGRIVWPLPLPEPTR